MASLKNDEFYRLAHQQSRSSNKWHCTAVQSRYWRQHGMSESSVAASGMDCTVEQSDLASVATVPGETSLNRLLQFSTTKRTLVWKSRI